MKQGSDRELLLGRQVRGSDRYDPDLLCPIARREGRERLGLPAILPFHGEDIWHAYELSWLEPDGRPRVAAAVLSVPADSPRIVESKSLKLYLNSLNGTAFPDPEALRAQVMADLAEATGAPVALRLSGPEDAGFHGQPAPGVCVDEEASGHFPSSPEAAILEAAPGEVVEETLCSHLLRTLCPVTAQPDWATLVVSYRGPRLDRASLLRYVVSFRRHQDFHEQCAERIYRDLCWVLAPGRLSVHALYTRRGGLDISPWRSSAPGAAPRYRLYRQ